MKKSLAVIKSDELRGCPFGLTPISLVCKNAGQSVSQMKSLDDVPTEQREKYALVNRKIYRHEQDGTRCPFADQILEGKGNLVNCDHEEGAAAGEHSVPLRPSPFFPKVFMGGMNGNLWGFPLGDYASNPDANSSANPPSTSRSYDPEIHAGLVEEYLKTGTVKIYNFNENEVENHSLSQDFYQFSNSYLVNDANSEDPNGNY